MRDKMMDIVEQSFERQYAKMSLLTAKHTVDDLLANGVIVPPVKVGQTVYKIMKFCDDSKDIIEGKIRYLYFTEDNETLIYTTPFGSTHKVSEIGKTVFLTREEAEAALKGDVNEQQ